MRHFSTSAITMSKRVSYRSDQTNSVRPLLTSTDPIQSRGHRPRRQLPVPHIPLEKRIEFGLELTRRSSFTASRANELNLTGRVQNDSDGSVCALSAPPMRHRLKRFEGDRRSSRRPELSGQVCAASQYGSVCGQGQQGRSEGNQHQGG